MKKIVRLTERDLSRIVRRVIKEQATDCSIEWSKVKKALENKINMSDIDITSYVCAKDQSGFIKGQTPDIDEEKLKCVHIEMGEWCKSQGYTYKGPQ
jgi:hypothetical protein